MEEYYKIINDIKCSIGNIESEWVCENFADEDFQGFINFKNPTIHRLMFRCTFEAYSTLKYLSITGEDIYIDYRTKNNGDFYINNIYDSNLKEVLYCD